MILILTHVIIAVLSLIFTTILVVFPSSNRIHLSYVLVGLTLLSGIALIIFEHAAIISTCLSGLAYLFFASLEIFIARKRLFSST